MAWIESHQTLARHPKTLHLAALLKTSKPTVLGHLHLLWWWALDYAPDGDLSAFDARTIAEAAEWRRDPDVFLDALVQSRWLDDERTVHDWYDYAGRLIEQRAANRERMRKSRSRNVRRTEPARSPHVPVTDSATNQDQTKPTKNLSSKAADDAEETDGTSAWWTRNGVADHDEAYLLGRLASIDERWITLRRSRFAQIRSAAGAAAVKVALQHAWEEKLVPDDPNAWLQTAAIAAGGGAA